MTQPIDTTHRLTMPLYSAPTRADGVALLNGASWDDLLSITVNLGELAKTQEAAETVSAVRRLIRIGRRAGDFEEYDPERIEQGVTHELRHGEDADVLLALMPILDAIRALRVGAE
jgi:hypothetical protein